MKIIADKKSTVLNVILVFILSSIISILAYASVERRVEIARDIAIQSGIKTQLAGSGEIDRTLTVYGKLVADANSISHVRARFPGTITSVSANIGDRVERGARLAEVESNESLKRYSIKAPFSGMVTARHATSGEATGQQSLFTVANFSKVWAEFQIFPSQLRRVDVGQNVAISAAFEVAQSAIKHLIPSDNGQPFIVARAPIDNVNGQWIPGMLVVGKVSVDKFRAPLVVDNRALHSLDGADVVFIAAGDSYEARPLKLGRSDGRITEVLAGLKAGEQYVVNNSYLIKADLEKSGASHSH